MGPQGLTIPISAVTRIAARIDVSLSRQQIHDLPPVAIDRPQS